MLSERHISGGPERIHNRITCALTQTSRTSSPLQSDTPPSSACRPWNLFCCCRLGKAICREIANRICCSHKVEERAEKNNKNNEKTGKTRINITRAIQIPHGGNGSRFDAGILLIPFRAASPPSPNTVIDPRALILPTNCYGRSWLARESSKWGGFYGRLSPLRNWKEAGEMSQSPLPFAQWPICPCHIVDAHNSHRI